MPTIPTAIWEAVKARVLTLPLGLPMAMPLLDFTTPAENGPYLRVTFIPARNIRRALSGSGAHRRIFLLQIDVFTPRNEELSVGIERAGKIAEHFPSDLRMRFDNIGVRVAAEPFVAQMLTDGAYGMVPVTIQLETLA